MPQAATIKSLPRAFRMMNAMQAQGIEWGEDDRHAGAEVLKDVLEGRMAAGIIAIWRRRIGWGKPTGARLDRNQTAATAAG